MVVKTSETLETLRHLKRKYIVAGKGKDGANQGKTGKRGDNAEIWVPVGTKITVSVNGGEAVYSEVLDKRQRSVVVAQGGRGGKGNTAFKSPTNQEPLLCQAGEKGAEAILEIANSGKVRDSFNKIKEIGRPNMRLKK